MGGEKCSFRKGRSQMGLNTSSEKHLQKKIFLLISFSRAKCYVDGAAVLWVHGWLVVTVKIMDCGRFDRENSQL